MRKNAIENRLQNAAAKHIRIEAKYAAAMPSSASNEFEFAKSIGAIQSVIGGLAQEIALQGSN